MKTVYLVRHGESEGNAGNLRQTPDMVLTEHGQKQAHLVAKRVASLDIEKIISSPWQRAKQTAETIGQKIPHEIVYSDLFIERLCASEIMGTPRDDPHTLEIEHLYWQHWHDENWHYSDEENWRDLKRRAEAALSFLEDQPEQTLLVVTHGLFLRTLMAAILGGDQFDSYLLRRFIRGLAHKNTALSAIVFDDSIKPPAWHLWIWNDHAHL